ncbi:hypothetical protein [Desulfolutivibrio sp.]|uniref:hypothetical protein n=1 Tax=Desulfolutivibrio sp. TaxID=2773296 RepID=UPI002F96CFAB
MNFIFRRALRPYSSDRRAGFPENANDATSVMEEIDSTMTFISEIVFPEISRKSVSADFNDAELLSWMTPKSIAPVSSVAVETMLMRMRDENEILTFFQPRIRALLATRGRCFPPGPPQRLPPADDELLPAPGLY